MFLYKCPFLLNLVSEGLELFSILLAPSAALIECTEYRMYNNVQNIYIYTCLYLHIYIAQTLIEISPYQLCPIPFPLPERECWITPAAFGLAPHLFVIHSFDATIKSPFKNVVAMKNHQVLELVVFTYDTFFRVDPSKNQMLEWFINGNLIYMWQLSWSKRFPGFKASTHGESCEPGVACALWCRDWATGALPKFTSHQVIY